MTIVLKVLKDYHHNDSLPSFHYNNMLEELQIVAPDITEETLLQHGEFIVQQIHSYDTSADNDEQNLLSAPFIKELCKFIGVSLQALESSSAERGKTHTQRHMYHGKNAMEPSRAKIASTTPLVRHVFTSLMKQRAQLRKEKMANKIADFSKCGVCKGCLEKECGSCQNCLNMIKFAGSGMSRKGICKLKQCEKLKVMENVKDSQPEIYERQMRYMREKTTRVKWIGDAKDYQGSKYYDAADVNNERLEVGDFILVRPDDQNTTNFICRIINFESDGSEKITHVQTYCRGTDTLLGETADPKELFAMIDCESIPCYEIIRKVDVWYWPGPKKWKLAGGSKQSTYTPSDELNDNFCYWFRLMYNPALGRFEVIPPLLLKVKPSSEPTGCCPICKYLDVKDKYAQPQAIQVNEYGVKHDRITLRNEEFRVGDAVFLTSSGVIEQKSNVFTNPKSNVDSNVYTEYYRKFIKTNESVKGSLADFPKPFEIGVIREIITDKKPICTMIRVRRMLRPEDTNIKNPNQYDLNLLFFTDKENIISAERIEGKCYIVPKDMITGEPFVWTQKGTHRFYYEKMYNVKTKEFSRLPLGYKEIHASSLYSSDAASELPILPEHEKMKLMDVYAGCGGLSIGLDAAGISKTTWAVEDFPPAAEAFKLNHPDASVIQEDCNRFLSKCLDGSSFIPTKHGNITLPKKEELDILVGGPPCQGFSIMNNFNDREYSRIKNSQISTFLSILDFYRPRYFILENVRNLANFNGNMVFKLLMRTLVMIGYQCTFGVLQGGAFGIPQTRHRIFVIAAAPGEKLPVYPEPLHVFRGANASVRVDGKLFRSNIRWTSAPFRTTTTRDAMYDLPRMGNSERQPEVRKYGRDPISYMQKHYRWNDKTKKFLPNLVDHISRQVDPLNEARLKHIPKTPGADWRDLPNIR